MSHVLVMFDEMLGTVALVIKAGRSSCMTLGSIAWFDVIRIDGSVQWKNDV